MMEKETEDKDSGMGTIKTTPNGNRQTPGRSRGKRRRTKTEKGNTQDRNKENGNRQRTKAKKGNRGQGQKLGRKENKRPDALYSSAETLQKFANKIIWGGLIYKTV